MKYTYEPTEFCKAKPIRMQCWKNPKRTDFGKVWVSLGQDITINYSPPKKPKVVLEASQTQYEYLYNAGYTRYIKRVEVKESKEIIENN